MFAEYVGLTQEALTLVEHFRCFPGETRSEIIVRVLSPLIPSPAPKQPADLDLGQGARLYVGERPILFLSVEAKRANRPDAMAEVREDGFYLGSHKISSSKAGNPLDPAMKIVQRRKNHLNDRGEIISLSAWRQWHVVRNGKLVSMNDLKDPKLARKRGHSRSELTLADLDIDLEA